MFKGNENIVAVGRYLSDTKIQEEYLASKALDEIRCSKSDISGF